MNYPNNGLLTLDFTNIENISVLDASSVIKESTQKQLKKLVTKGTSKIILLMFASQCFIGSLSLSDTTLSVSDVYNGMLYDIVLNASGEITQVSVGELIFRDEFDRVATFLEPFEDDLLTTTDKNSVSITEAEMNRLINGLENRLKINVEDNVMTIDYIYEDNNTLEVACGCYVSGEFGTVYSIEINKSSKTLSTTYIEA